MNRNKSVFESPVRPYTNYVYTKKTIDRSNCIVPYADIVDRVFDVGSKKELRRYGYYIVGELEFKNEDELESYFYNKGIRLNNTYSKRENVFPYHYNIKYSEEKIRVSCKVIGFSYYKGNLITQIYSTALVFNLKTGRTYLLGTRDQKDRFIKINGNKDVNVRSTPIMDITYASKLTLIGMGVYNFVNIPDKEWNNIIEKIKDYNKVKLGDVNEKDSRVYGHIEAIRFNRFPNIIDIGILLNMNVAIKIKGMRTNLLSYIERDMRYVGIELLRVIDKEFENNSNRRNTDNYIKLTGIIASIVNNKMHNMKSEEKIKEVLGIYVCNLFLKKKLDVSIDIICKLSNEIVKNKLVNINYKNKMGKDNEISISLDECIIKWFKMLKRAKLLIDESEINNIVEILYYYKSLYEFEIEDNLSLESTILETKIKYKEWFKLKNLIEAL